MVLGINRLLVFEFLRKKSVVKFDLFLLLIFFFFFFFLWLNVTTLTKMWYFPKNFMILKDLKSKYRFSGMIGS